MSIRRAVVKKYSVEFYATMKNSEGEKYIHWGKKRPEHSFKNKSYVHVVGCNFCLKQKDRPYLQMYKNVQKATRATIEQWISLGKGSQVDGQSFEGNFTFHFTTVFWSDFSSE